MKKHFILLGPAGLILYSWIFVILFIGLIICYEGMQKFNILGTIIIIVFFIIFIFSFLTSYYTDNNLKLPYRKRFKLLSQPKTIWSWKQIKIKVVLKDSYQKYYLFRIEK